MTDFLGLEFLGFDHLIYLVDDPLEASRRFEKLGFSISDRDDDDVAAHEHRLVCLHDGSYLELVRFRDPEYLRKHRFVPLGSAGGWADCVIVTGDIEGARAAALGAGLKSCDTVKRQRTLVTGETWEVWLSFLGRGAGDPVLPMLAEDKKLRHSRIPQYALDHANGAMGIAGVTYLVSDLAAAKSLLGKLYRELPSVEEGTARYAMGENWIMLRQPVDTSGPEAQRLAAVGNCILSVSIGGPDGVILELGNDS